MSLQNTIIALSREFHGFQYSYLKYQFSTFYHGCFTARERLNDAKFNLKDIVFRNVHFRGFQSLKFNLKDIVFSNVQFRGLLVIIFNTVYEHI